MPHLNRRALLTASLGALLCSACGPDTSERQTYQILLILKGPFGRATGVGVVEFSKVTGSSLDMHAYHYRGVRAGAIPLRMPDGRYLFGTVDGSSHSHGFDSISYWTSNDPIWMGEEDGQEPLSWTPMLESRKPMIIGFRDRLDPRSMFMVQPVEGSYSPYVVTSYKAYIRKVDMPISRDIFEYIPWASNRMAYLLPGESCEARDFPTCLQVSNIATGIRK